EINGEGNRREIRLYQQPGNGRERRRREEGDSEVKASDQKGNLSFRRVRCIVGKHRTCVAAAVFFEMFRQLAGNAYDTVRVRFGNNFQRPDDSMRRLEVD